jgi:MFS superfamily sulfate permease-like transporter
MCGLGIIIFISTFDNFKECIGKEKFTDCSDSELKYMPIDAPRTYVSLIIIAITMCFCKFLPMLKWRNIGNWVPASLIAIILASIWEHLISRPLMGI